MSHDRRVAVDVLRALRRAAPGLSVELVDPRNTGDLLPTVIAAAHRRGDSWPRAVRSGVEATTAWTLIIDGRVVSRGQELTPERALAALNRASTDRTPTP